MFQAVLWGVPLILLLLGVGVILVRPALERGRVEALVGGGLEAPYVAGESERASAGTLTPARPPGAYPVWLLTASATVQEWLPFLRRPFFHRLPVIAVGIYLATRLFSAVLLLIAASQQGPNPWAENPGYTEFTGLWWDAGWYSRILTEEYAVPVPLDGQSTWAFLPLFSMIVGTFMTLTGQPFMVVAPFIALVAGTAAAGLLAVLIRDGALKAGGDRTSARFRALAAVILLGLYPAAPVLQVAYADSLALLLVVATLLLLLRRRYLLAIPVVLALGFTRPIALPILAVVIWHAWHRLRDSGDDVSRTERWQLLGLTVASGFAGIAWPLVTGIAGGQWDAYLKVQEMWRNGDSVAPVLAWFSFAGDHLGALGWILVALAIAGAVLTIAHPSARSLGPEVRVWTGAYLAWLLIAVQPHSSTIRQLILAIGVPLVLVGVSRLRLGVLALISAFGQILWVFVLWKLGIAAGWPP